MTPYVYVVFPYFEGVYGVPIAVFWSSEKADEFCRGKKLNWVSIAVDVEPEL